MGMAAMLLMVAAAVWQQQNTLAGASSDTLYFDDERFPNWKGEAVKLGARNEIQLGLDLYGVQALRHTRETVRGVDGQALFDGEVYQFSESPGVYLYKNFLSVEERNYLIDNARSSLKPSTAVEAGTGKIINSTARTSHGSFYSKWSSDTVSAIEERIAAVTGYPEENQEAVTILRYENGQKYDPHTDFFHDEVQIRAELGGQRVATVLMYLSSVKDGAGGETVFPYIKIPNDTRDPDMWSSCAREGLAMKATAGDALIFYYMKEDGTLDPLSEHGSCPTMEGEKWSATVWIRKHAHYGTIKPRAGCYDGHVECEPWAARGECDINPGYMRANCRKACKICHADEE